MNTPSPVECVCAGATGFLLQDLQIIDVVRGGRKAGQGRGRLVTASPDPVG